MERNIDGMAPHQSSMEGDDFRHRGLGLSKTNRSS